MRTITASDTLKLSIPERISLVEEIWDTIAAEEYISVIFEWYESRRKGLGYD